MWEGIWSKIKSLMGFGTETEEYEEILCALHQDVKKRNFIFYLFIITYELVMLVSISLRPGGPFLKPRRTAYFIMYLILIVISLCTILAERRVGRSKEKAARQYFMFEHTYMVLFAFWGIAVTLNDQLGGNGLTVYTYVILLIAIMSLMKPWMSVLLFLTSVVLLNALLPQFPDPAGLDQSFNNLMNSLFLSLAAIAVSVSLYNSKIQAKRNEILLRRQYRQVESEKMALSEEALLDAMTGLQNRNSYKKMLQDFEGNDCVSVACIYIDVNGLHEINNHLGHQAGDSMLKTVAYILRKNFRSGEIFRIGGDEFVILCRGTDRRTVEQRLDTICGQVNKEGYSLSVGMEWCDNGINIKDIIQKAESKMQQYKKDYYASQGGIRQQRELNRRMENILSEKKDADRFLSVFAPVFKGVYFVNLETDTSRQLFIPDYFSRMLEESGGRFSKAILMYARQLVEPEYEKMFERFCDYESLENLLGEEDIPDFTYRKKDGSHVRLRILSFNHYTGNEKETLWIFSDIEANEFL